MDDELLDRFIHLFRGRTDVYGSEEGGCIKSALTREVYADHLLGTAPIGVYPMVPKGGEWYCVWGCIDIDTGDYDAACKLQEALLAGGVYSHIEASRSKGYHVWVFTSAPVTARSMRHMLLAAHQVADYPAREVNPKQETLGINQYGNYVRLPYPNHADLSVPNRRVLDSSGNPVSLGTFIALAESQLTEPETVERLAGYYKEPQRVGTVHPDYVQCESLPEAMKHLSPLGRVIWRDGPLPNRDRSSTLYKLAHTCRESGLNPSEARIVLVDADRRWGKYHLRLNGELEIDKMIVRVYN